MLTTGIVSKCRREQQSGLVRNASAACPLTQRDGVSLVRCHGSGSSISRSGDHGYCVCRPSVSESVTETIMSGDDEGNHDCV